MRVLIFGTFDLLHPGHQFLLTEAVKRGELTVVIARDATVERLKGRLPVQSEGERMTAVNSFIPVAHVILGDVHDYLGPVRSTHPDLILLGYDQKLPPGVTEASFPCPVERMKALKPEQFKTSLRRKA